MPREKLQRLIASLHDELGSAASVDAESKELLQQLTRDIENIAAGEGDASATTASGQLEQATLRFETEHPRLSMILSEIIDTLGKLGI